MLGTNKSGVTRANLPQPLINILPPHDTLSLHCSTLQNTTAQSVTLGGVGLTMSRGLISYAETFSHAGESRSDHTLFLSRHRRPLSNPAHAFHFPFLHLTANHCVQGCPSEPSKGFYHQKTYLLIWLTFSLRPLALLYG